MKRRLTTALMALIALVILSGCSEDKPKVELTYVEWDSEIASTNIVKAVLQEKMGYEVTITPVSEAAMWEATATGDSDGNVAAWLPTTSGHYMERFEEEVVNLGPNLEGTRVGLVAPAYVKARAIDELGTHGDRFNYEIVGIDPGAGIMSQTESVMEQYGLKEFTLVESSDASMTAALQSSIRNEEWIVVTGWTPHWMFARWDLEYLDDPKNLYGGAEQIDTIVRQGLQEDMPEVYEFLDNFYWTPDDMAEVLVWNQESGADPYENAKRWIAENEDKVAQWLPSSYVAKSE